MSPTPKVHPCFVFSSKIERLESRIAPAAFVVTSLRDSGTGSLRDAIEHANAAAGDDTITFSAKVHGTIKLASVLEITDSVTIDATGRKISISGNSKTQLFAVNGTGLDVEFDGLTFTKGKAESGGAVSINDAGGTVTFSKSNFSKNLAIGADGNDAVRDASPGVGGAIAIDAGSLTIQQSKITGNQARGGDGLKSTIKVDGVPYTYEYGGGDAQGGAVYVGQNAEAHITGTKFTKNSVTGGKGLSQSTGSGGAIWSAGTLEVGSSNFSKNRASAEATSEGGAIYSSGTASLDGVTISRNAAVPNAGAKSTQAFGGGIFSADDAELTVQKSTVTGNTALGASGSNGSRGTNGANGANGQDGYNGGKGYDGSSGYYGDSGGYAYGGGYGGYGGNALGGGVFNGGTLTLQTSTISGNKAIAGSGGNGGDGGNGGRGGKGGDGGNGGPAFTYQGYHYPAGLGGSGGDGGSGGAGGSGGSGGYGGNAHGGGVYNTEDATLTNTSTISGNTTKSGKGGAAGDGGVGGLGGAGGKKGSGRAAGGEYDYAPHDGRHGDRGYNGEDGVRGMDGSAAGPDVFTPVPGTIPFGQSALTISGITVRDVFGPSTWTTEAFLDTRMPVLQSVQLFADWHLESIAKVEAALTPDPVTQLAAIRLEGMGMIVPPEVALGWVPS